MGIRGLWFARPSASGESVMRAWNGWYHVTGCTYGCWLPGDPRGWRTRRHREHVEGDYRHPPAEAQYEVIYEQSKALLKHAPVQLSQAQRRAAGEALVEMLSRLGVEVIAISVDAVHYHILGRFLDGQVRRRVGLAKKHASHVLREHGLVGAVWAKRSRPLPITNRAHQLNACRYIADHAEYGAWMWTFREGLYWVGNDGNTRTK